MADGEGEGKLAPWAQMGRFNWAACNSREENDEVAVGSQRDGGDGAIAESSRYAWLQDLIPYAHARIN